MLTIGSQQIPWDFPIRQLKGIGTSVHLEILIGQDIGHPMGSTMQRVMQSMTINQARTAGYLVPLVS